MGILLLGANGLISMARNLWRGGRPRQISLHEFAMKVHGYRPILASVISAAQQKR